MNENQAKKLLKKSALQTTENFTDRLMEQIDAAHVIQELPLFPSIKEVVLITGVVMLLLSFLIFNTNFRYDLEIGNVFSISRTKLFLAVLFLVVLGVNYILKLYHSLKYICNDPDTSDLLGKFD